jgi:hypothetical protein
MNLVVEMIEVSNSSMESFEFVILVILPFSEVVSDLIDVMSFGCVRKEHIQFF